MTTSAAAPSSERTAMTDLPATSNGGFLVLGVAKHDDQKVKLLAVEAITNGDILTVRDETLWHGVRDGKLSYSLESLCLMLVPGTRLEGGVLDGYSVELTDAESSDGRRKGGRNRFRRRFSVHSLDQAGRRAVRRLLKNKQLASNDKVNYCLYSVSSTDSLRTQPRPAVEDARIVTRFNPPVFEEAPLQEYIDGSKLLTHAAAADQPTEEEDARLFAPAFIAEEAWRQGRDFAQRGNDLESAAVWVGRLMRDVKTRTVFMLIDACLEAKHAAEAEYSVTFSGATWARLRTTIEQRRVRLNRPHEIMLGSVHGHNFPLHVDTDGGSKCPVCEHRQTCALTTAVASSSDVDWHRCVFAAQPWAVLGLWGSNARNEQVWRMYGLADGTLMPRGIRILTA